MQQMIFCILNCYKDQKLCFNIENLWLTVHPENIASMRVAEKLTFEKTGKSFSIKTKTGYEPRAQCEAPRGKPRGITASRVTFGHNSSFACPLSSFP
jgi:hypothetical protein